MLSLRRVRQRWYWLEVFSYSESMLWGCGECGVEFWRHAYEVGGEYYRYCASVQWVVLQHKCTCRRRDITASSYIFSWLQVCGVCNHLHASYFLYFKGLSRSGGLKKAYFRDFFQRSCDIFTIFVYWILIYNMSTTICQILKKKNF